MKSNPLLHQDREVKATRKIMFQHLHVIERTCFSAGIAYKSCEILYEDLFNLLDDEVDIVKPKKPKIKITKTPAKDVNIEPPFDSMLNFLKG